MTDPVATVPIVSVVIPFYNAGHYSVEAIESVERYPDRSAFEIIVVNDGSTDAESLRILERIGAERGLRIVHQENRGPAAARNAGIRVAQGRYVLLLDSDNRIRPRYLAVGIDILDADSEVAVVHGNPAFFGASDRPRFKSRPFDLQRIIAGNYIDNCTVIRKSAWSDVGEFDEARVLIGHEDWEFWIRVGASGWKFRHVDETLFDYRVRSDSLVNSVSSTDREAMHRYLVAKHLRVVMDEYGKLVQFRRHPMRYLLKRLFSTKRAKAH